MLAVVIATLLYALIASRLFRWDFWLCWLWSLIGVTVGWTGAWALTKLVNRR